MSEKARAARLIRPADRLRFTRGRAALRRILSRQTDIAPQHLDIVPDEAGRPRLAGNNQFDFNCSRTGNFTVVALSRRCRLGVDIERRRDDFPCTQLARSFFSPAENRALERLPAERHTAGFFQAWVSKEACVKAWGMGLSLPLDSFDVEADPRRAPALLARRGATAPLWLHEIEGPAGHAVALASDRPLGRIDVRPVTLADLCGPAGGH
ncbi:4'-phosphopantetheinyl transferase superfamily protein [Zavarzinia compransoris]|uniref:4'-phosphopantetheinyl transferase family protein n=1 Tax=Zavarzinia marina TaxID=2911065 RepID=UPI001F32EFF6|nr:4'-phosphopantetheinyl transferase superfamily protein [Zavarzinia marina]MCF4166147.1 4'-phosphopantetheinyl transferase superfamily protein [Zavarzinia marina]